MARRSLGSTTELSGLRFLVSAGPTHEPIDPVRYLANRSSGKMGFAIAAEAAERGAETVLVSGPVNLDTPPGVERVDVVTALEMYDVIHRHAPSADVIVMTAAVADFRPRVRARSKIKKELGAPTLELLPNPDILASLPAVAPQALRVGFAAETDFSVEEAWAKLDRKGADLLIWNDVATLGIGFGADHNEVTVYRHGATPLVIVRRPKREVAKALLDLFAEVLEHREAEALAPVG